MSSTSPPPPTPSRRSKSRSRYVYVAPKAPSSPATKPSTRSGGGTGTASLENQIKGIAAGTPCWGDVILYRIATEKTLQIAQERNEIPFTTSPLVYLPFEGLARVLPMIAQTSMSAWGSAYVHPVLFQQYLESSGFERISTLDMDGYKISRELWDSLVGLGKKALDSNQSVFREELFFSRERYQVYPKDGAIGSTALKQIDCMFARVLHVKNATHRLYKTHVIFAAENRPMFAFLKAERELLSWEQSSDSLLYGEPDDDPAAIWLQKGEKATLCVGTHADLPSRPFILLCLIGLGLTVLKNDVKYEPGKDPFMTFNFSTSE